jgi:hypothetical protein
VTSFKFPSLETFTSFGWLFKRSPVAAIFLSMVSSLMKTAFLSSSLETGSLAWDEVYDQGRHQEEGQ